MKRPGRNWIIVDVFDSISDTSIIVAVAMGPYRAWCKENLVSGTWYNDLYGTPWYEFYFSNPEDATAFILMSGGTKVIR